MYDCNVHVIIIIIINPRRACAARVTFCHSVCLLPRFLPLRTTRRPISDTNGFSATLALYLKIAFFVIMLRSKVMAFMHKQALAEVNKCGVHLRRLSLSTCVHGLPRLWSRRFPTLSAAKATVRFHLYSTLVRPNNVLERIGAM